MIFYGLVAHNENPYKPFLKFEAENIKEALEYTKGARKHDATLLVYIGYKRTTKTNQTIYCIQEIRELTNFQSGRKSDMTYKIMDEKGSTVQNWKGFEYTGELMLVEYKNGAIEALRVIKGKYTPYGAVRDCGDHYIKANYASFTRIDKGTMKETRDVEDC